VLNMFFFTSVLNMCWLYKIYVLSSWSIGEVFASVHCQIMCFFLLNTHVMCAGHRAAAICDVDHQSMLPSLITPGVFECVCIRLFKCSLVMLLLCLLFRVHADMQQGCLDASKLRMNPTHVIHVNNFCSPYLYVIHALVICRVRCACLGLLDNICCFALLNMCFCSRITHCVLAIEPCLSMCLYVCIVKHVFWFVSSCSSSLLMFPHAGAQETAVHGLVYKDDKHGAWYESRGLPP
jgi:hypothetical protein